MPRSHAVPAYQKHASGQARVAINGRDHYLGIYGSPESKVKYQELVRRHGADRLIQKPADAVRFVEGGELTSSTSMAAS